MLSNASTDFTKKDFDLTSMDLSSITISETFDKTNCYIHSKDSKLKVVDNFIIKDLPQTKRVCTVSFYPDKNNKFVPRLEFKILNKDETVKSTSKDQRISFSSSDEGLEEFWKLINFLSSFKDLVDTGEFQKIYQIITAEDYSNFLNLKNDADKVLEISNVVEKTNMSTSDIEKVLSNKRIKSLEKFATMLDEKLQESEWHSFFKEEHWILGLGLDVKFIREFFNQVEVGISDTANKGSARGDMLGVNDYTILVELKTPQTKIFTVAKKSTKRTNTWSFSDNFIDGVSQCLAQKFDWEKASISKDIKNPITKEYLDKIKVRTEDVKSIFIIGNKSKEFSEKSKTEDTVTKRDTFELFRRNNRNLEIMTYDELYERAYYIVHDKKFISLESNYYEI